MTQTLVHRTADGIANIATKDGGTIQVKVPDNWSVLGVLGHNPVISGGDYREDGWVYIDDKPVRKWFVSIGRTRVWEPRLDDIESMYHLYKRTIKAHNMQWDKVTAIMKELWAKRRSKGTTEVQAHCIPTHKFVWHGDSQPWWVYKIHQYNSDKETLCFGFDWLDEKPEKVVNHKLGEALYKESQHAFCTSGRFGAVKDVFYTAMRRKLPYPTENKVVCFKFGEDTFWFHTAMNSGGYLEWKMFDDFYKFEIKEMLD